MNVEHGCFCVFIDETRLKQSLFCVPDARKGAFLAKRFNIDVGQRTPFRPEEIGNPDCQAALHLSVRSFHLLRKSEKVAR
jgi:hypothetical protein